MFTFVWNSWRTRQERDIFMNYVECRWEAGKNHALCYAQTCPLPSQWEQEFRCERRYVVTCPNTPSSQIKARINIRFRMFRNDPSYSESCSNRSGLPSCWQSNLDHVHIGILAHVLKDAHYLRIVLSFADRLVFDSLKSALYEPEHFGHDSEMVQEINKMFSSALMQPKKRCSCRTVCYWEDSWC